MNGEDLTRLLAEGDEGCWSSFVEKEQGRWLRQAERFLGGRADLASDVVQDALIRVFQAIVPQRLEIPEPARYVAGFVRKVAQEQWRKKRGEELNEGHDLETSTTSARVARADAETQARRSLRRVLEEVRAGIREESTRATRQERTAPILHWAFLDLVASEVVQTVEVAEWLGLSPASLVRFRERAVERLVSPMTRFRVWDVGLAGAPAIDGDSVREFVERGPVFRGVWIDECYGCPAELLRGLAVHEAHAADVDVWGRVHRERVGCPVCRDRGAGPATLGATEIVDLVRRASRSLFGPGWQAR